jgi:orotidine-5'-phosphate decarboxylase
MSWTKTLNKNRASIEIHYQQVVVALDGMSEKEALRIAKMFRGRVWGFKINDMLFEGTAIIGKLKKFGKVFADAKLHDIPNTVAHSVARLSKAGADIITVHGSGGVAMMQAAHRHAGTSMIVAVTMLTSSSAVKGKVSSLVRDALRAGVDGVVCSGRDLGIVRRLSKKSPLFVIVPGIRPAWYTKKDDQKRTVTPREAVRRGADLLVIGRPILNSPDPINALANI